MSTLQAIVLGIVQGLTEFLPISSTAHLRIVPAFLGWEDPGAAFTAITQLGTMAAVVIYFRSSLWSIVKATVGGLTDASKRQTLEFRLGLYILLGTIPISVCGLLFSGSIEGSARSLYIIGTTLILLGLLLLLSEKVGRRTRKIESLRLRDGIVIGCAQAVALIPGVSRSGATMTAGLFLNFERSEAARYSFLLSVPAVVLSGLFELRKIAGEVPVIPTATATFLAFVVGWLSIAGLLRFLAHRSTLVFVVYRVGLGVVVLGAASAGVIA